MTPGDDKKKNSQEEKTTTTTTTTKRTPEGKKKKNSEVNNSKATNTSTPEKGDVFSRLACKDGTPVSSPSQSQQQKKNATTTPENNIKAKIDRTVSQTVQPPKAHSPMKQENSPTPTKLNPPSGLMPPLTVEKTKTKDTTPSNNSALDKEIELLRTENQQLKAAAATSGRLAAALGRATKNAVQAIEKREGRGEIRQRDNGKGESEIGKGKRIV